MKDEMTYERALGDAQAAIKAAEMHYRSLVNCVEMVLVLRPDQPEEVTMATVVGFIARAMDPNEMLEALAWVVLRDARRMQVADTSDHEDSP